MKARWGQLLGIVGLLCVGAEGAAAACVIDGLRLSYERSCSDISSGRLGELTAWDSAKLSLIAGRSAPFSCSMLNALSKRRIAMRPDGGPWSPVQANELGHAHSVTFSSSAQSALALVALDLNQTCQVAKPVAFLIWTRTGQTTVQAQNTCRPARVLLTLRLGDVCSGTVNVLAVEGSGSVSEEPSEKVAFVYRRFEIDVQGTEQMFAQKQSFRNRWQDLENYHSKRRDELSHAE